MMYNITVPNGTVEAIMNKHTHKLLDKENRAIIKLREVQI